MNDDGVSASFLRGTFLNFISHAICLFYLGVSVYVSTVRFHGKHRRDGMVIIMCVVLVLATVAAEMITKRNDLLNIVCEICAMVNYIFIMTINSSRDPLTNLYDRRTYLEDLSRYQDVVNGVIMIDMNELKFVNDNYGHQTGDEALISLAKIFESSIDQSIMCAYRVSGDEFTILMFQGKIEQLDEVVTNIREKMREGKYTAAIGTCFIDTRANGISFQEALRKAEELMYIDKSKYYDTTGHARR
jgi:diguanylate cyclase (GGDEF)-like protein